MTWSLACSILLFSVGTCAYTKRIEEDFAKGLPEIKSLASLDTSRMGVQVGVGEARQHH